MTDPGRRGGEGTGWHMHGASGPVHREPTEQIPFHKPRPDGRLSACYAADPTTRPILVLDPVTARDTIARALVGHRYQGSYSMWCTCNAVEPLPKDHRRIAAGYVPPNVAALHRAHLADAVLAALASQERGE